MNPCSSFNQGWVKSPRAYRKLAPAEANRFAFRIYVIGDCNSYFQFLPFWHIHFHFIRESFCCTVVVDMLSSPSYDGQSEGGLAFFHKIRGRTCSTHAAMEFNSATHASGSIAASMKLLLHQTYLSQSNNSPAKAKRLSSKLSRLS